MNWLHNLNIEGFLVGLIAFVLIGLFHPIVIHVERRFGKKVWPVFFFPGVILAVVSVLITQKLLSVGLGVLAFSLFWSAIELIKQHKRVLERKSNNKQANN